MKALLVDDERLSRVGLRRLLKGHADLSIVGEASNADEAAGQIQRLQPDLLFLDVEMPGRSGLEMLSQLNVSCALIFTTAYEQHALAAFNAGAVDYLLKPIVPARLDLALDRARKFLEKKKTAVPYSRRFLLRRAERYWIVPSTKIRLLESEGNYTKIHFDGNCVTVCKSLNALQLRLDPNNFFRASRAHIINLQEVKHIQSQPDGKLLANLGDGLQVPISRRQASRLTRLLAP